MGGPRKDGSKLSETGYRSAGAAVNAGVASAVSFKKGADGKLASVPGGKAGKITSTRKVAGAIVDKFGARAARANFQRNTTSAKAIVKAIAQDNKGKANAKSLKAVIKKAKRDTRN